MQQFDTKKTVKKNWIRRVTVYCTLFLFPILYTGNASANVYVTTTFTDPVFTAVNNATGAITAGAGIGLVSLRSALKAADNLGGTHTITLGTGTYLLDGSTSYTVPSLGTFSGRTIYFGNTAQNITINGNGPGNTIISMAVAGRDRIMTINYDGVVPNVFTTINGVKFLNGYLTKDEYGGAALYAGPVAGLDQALIVNNCAFEGNICPAGFSGPGNGGSGGAIYMFQETLTIDNCTFTNNSVVDGVGGAIVYLLYNNQGNNGDIDITNSTFTGNSARSLGGAIHITSQGGQPGGITFTVDINENTFVNNSTTVGAGGGVALNNGANLSVMQMHYNRFSGNTSFSPATSSGFHFIESAGSVNAENNWWGCNTNPVNAVSTAPCNQAGGDVPGLGSLDADPWLQLKTTASPNPICNTPAGLGNTSLVTTSFLSNSANQAIAVADLSRLIGLPVVWTSTLGSLSGQQLTIQASGTATATFTSNGTGGNATVNTQVDNVPVADPTARATIVVNTIPIVTDPVNFTSCVGGTATFTSTITGTPVPTITWYKGGVPIVNGPTGTGATYSGATTNTLTITNVQAGDAGNYNVDAVNQCGTDVSANATLFVNQVTGGTVAADQTICSGGDPAAFTVSVASTGSGALTYQWQSNTTSCVAAFGNIGGATAATYDPPSGLATTTYYRRVTTSTLNAVPCTANSNCITVTINNVAGGIVAADQTICSGGDPAAFTQGIAASGSGPLTYQWQSGTGGCAGAFSDIPGATAITYDPPAGLAITTYYRRVAISTLNGVPCPGNSNCITVTVNSVTGGTVAADQTICAPFDPAAFTQSVASTGSGALTYQWQSSTTDCTTGFSNIGGATATTYDPPSGLAVTTYYRRVTTSTLSGVPCTANSNCITVTINNVTGGTVATDQTICSGGDPAAFTESVASTGSGALTYQWQISTTGCGGAFSNIGGATAATYDPPAGLLLTTNYRRVTTSTLNGVPCTANSTCITVTVNSVTGGTIAADQVLCTPGDPALLTQTVASTGSGALTYQWQSSTTGCGGVFSDIGGATAITYDPPAGLLVTTNYRRVTTSTLSGVPCTANSNCITVTVNATNTVTLTSAPGTDAQTVQINTPITNITYATTGATGANVTGLPTGVNGVWAANVVTISGTPTVAGLFNYTVTLTGGCGIVTATGSINVITCGATLTSAPGTNAQSVCINTPITNITYSTITATGATFSGLPTGVTGIWAANTITISGTPSVAGIFNYTITLTGAGCVGITVNGSISSNDVTGGAVGSDQTVCSGGDPAAFTETVASTGTGTLTYQWQSSTTDCLSGFSNIGGATGTTYDPPAGLVVTTYYRRITISTLGGVPCTANSNCITVTINNVSGGIVAADQTFCSGGADPAPFTESVGSTGSGALTYQWQSSTTNCAGGFSDIGGATSATYDAPAGLLVTTFYRRVTTSTLNAVLCTANSNCITVSINNVTGGTVGSDHSVCPGGDPALLTQTVASTGSGALTYQWQSSTTDCLSGFSNIGGATGTTYDPPAGLATTTYYRRVTTSTLNAVLCTANSNCITVTVNPINTITLTSAPGTDAQTVLINTPMIPITYATTGATGATVTGLPTGVNGVWAANVVTISGTPTVAGLFNYTVTLTGGCGVVTATGFIDVVICSITLTSAPGTNAQTVCSNTPIINITYSTTGATGASFSGLPAGVSGNWAANVATISGTPTASGIFNYTVTPTGGGCSGAVTATGMITVNPTPVAVATPSSQTRCSGVAIATIVLSSSTPGTTYTWTRDNVATVTGIAASGSGNISGTLTNTTTAPITVTFTITPTAGVCTGPTTTATVLVNPTPNAVAAPPSQTICSGTAITAIALSGNVAGTTYTWTRTNTVNITGMGASGSGNPITGTLTNNTNTIQTTTFTITPTANGCAGPSTTATVTVNPMPTVTQPMIQVIITGNGGFADEITWTLSNSLPAVILSGGPYGFNPPATPSALVPATNAPFEFFIEAQGFFNDNSALWEVRCNGAVVASGCIQGTNNGGPCANIGSLTVSGIPGCDPLAPQTICSGSAIAPITLTGPVAGTVFNWTRDNTVNVTGIAASGTGTISGTLTNTTNVPQVVVFTITPSANGCNGTPVTATITVNPIPNAVATPSSQTICSGVAITPIALTGNVAGTVYSWTRNNTANVTGIPANGTGNISGTLTNTTTSLQTTTFTITPSYTNAGVTCTGTPITATVSVQAPLILTCPANITVNAAPGTCAATVTYAATVTGTPAPTVTYVPASGSSFPVGTTTVTVTATNICATVTCTFTVTVLDVQIPVISTQPLSQSKCVGDNVTFTVVSTFASSYQWQTFTGGVWVNIPGTNAPSYTLSNVTLAMNTNSYRVLITGPCGTVTASNHAVLNVYPIPVVVISASIPPILLPTDVLTLTANTLPPPQPGGTFVWRKNGNIIAGATGPTLGPLTVNDVGSYTVTYTVNGCSGTSAALVVSAKQSDHFYVYPNPNFGQFQVRFFNQVNEQVTVTVYDSKGSQVYQRKITTTTPYTSLDVNLGNNPQGSYLVVVHNSANQVVGSQWVVVFH